MEDLNIDTTDIKMIMYQQKTCWKEAQQLYCHKKQALRIHNKVILCDSVTGKYKKYCK